MEKRKRRSQIIIFSLVILSFAVLLLGKQYPITGLTIYSSDLINGTFNNTYFNGEAIQLKLSGNFSEGDYVGQIIGLEENTILDNFTWEDSKCFNTIKTIINKTTDNETIKNKKIKEIESIVLYESKIASNLTFFIKDCEDPNCENKSWIFIEDATEINLSNKYFQYKFKFKTENLSCSPKIYSIEINYEILNNTSNSSEPLEESNKEENKEEGNGITTEIAREKKVEEPVKEINYELEEVKEEILEIKQDPPKEDQNLITGFVTFTKNNVLIFNGFTLLLAIFILLYVFVIRRKAFGV